ncbi:MAG: hypothetical protein Aurels2KO_37980 [Aureliella sp.]
MKRFVASVVCLLTVAMASTAQAHFPWLTVNKDGKAALFFGENIADQTYKLPPTVAKAKIYAMADGKISEMNTETVDSEEFVGIVSDGKVSDKHQMLMSQMTYGIYHGNRLNYYTLHMNGDLPKKAVTIDHAKEKGLYAELVQSGDGVAVTVYWDGKPVEGTEVHLYCDEGHEEGVTETDANGTAKFGKKEVEDGLNGIMFGITRDDEAGSLDGEQYKSAMHYATITFFQK